MARSPSAEERALWRAAMREVDAAAPTVAPPRPAPSAAPAKAREARAAPAGAGLDRKNAARLKRGEMAIAGRLDLHGMTQDEAHRALVRFIERSHEAGARTVLIITGKGAGGGPGGREGAGSGAGVLRRAVPRWLGEARCRKIVLASEPAQPRHGGDGALYVLLRRKRE